MDPTSHQQLVELQLQVCDVVKRIGQQQLDHRVIITLILHFVIHPEFGIDRIDGDIIGGIVHGQSIVHLSTGDLCLQGIAGFCWICSLRFWNLLIDRMPPDTNIE